MKDDKNVKVRIPSTVNFDELFDGVKGGKTGHIDHPSPVLRDHASPVGKTTP